MRAHAHLLLSPSRGGREWKMEGVEHRTLQVNGINMHVAEKGEGPTVLLLHGFPELWYSWRHQIPALAERGYHAVAPDLRGYGDTGAPASPGAYTIFHIVGDIVALIDALGQEQVFVVGHDWGSLVAWGLCMLRPDKVRALVALSVPYRPRNPSHKPVDVLRRLCGEDYYVVRFQEPGVAEADFAQHKTSSLIVRSFTYVPNQAGSEQANSAEVTTLPSWLTEEDVNYYASKFEKSGFTGGLNYYRNLDVNWELTAPWTGVQIKVPAKFIVGDLDLTWKIPGVHDYIHKGEFNKDVPSLHDIVIIEGAGHFINQEKPREITEHIHDFIKRF